MELKYDGPESIPYLAFYPDEPKMVAEAEELYKQQVKAGKNPIVIAPTGHWHPITAFNQAYGSIEKRIYFD